MITSTVSRVVRAGIAAADAHELAGITYRQLDHWARQGWVRPSLDAGRGRAGRRLYSPDDVVRLDLLRHLAQSRVNTAQAGPLVAAFDPPADAIVIWGPVGGRDGDAPGLGIVARDRVVSELATGGAWVVYDPARIRHRLAGSEAADGRRATSPVETPAGTGSGCGTDVVNTPERFETKESA